MKNVDYIEDRLVTPYIVWKHLPTQTEYVDFPFVPKDTEYQRRRFYSDERPIKLEDFKKLQKGGDI